MHTWSTEHGRASMEDEGRVGRWRVQRACKSIRRKRGGARHALVADEMAPLDLSKWLVVTHPGEADLHWEGGAAGAAAGCPGRALEVRGVEVVARRGGGLVHAVQVAKSAQGASGVK